MNNLGHARLETVTKIMSFMPNTAAGIQRETKFTYSHILRVIRMMEERELITIKKEGPKVRVGELPFNYWLKPPNAPTYEENYKRHCSP